MKIGFCYKKDHVNSPDDEVQYSLDVDAEIVEIIADALQSRAFANISHGDSKGASENLLQELKLRKLLEKEKTDERADN